MELRKKHENATMIGKPKKRSGRDTVGWYLDSVKGHEVLSHPRVVELFQKLESGDASAARELAEKNLKLVVAVARAYRDKGVEWEDLLQEGNLGLVHAIEKFDWRRGNRFSTYATWWIRQRISHYLATQRHSIRVPTHAIRLRKHIEAAIEKLKDQGSPGSGEVSWERIAQEVGSSPDVVEATVAGSKSTVSLSAHPSEKDSYGAAALREQVTSEEDSAESILFSSQLKTAILTAVSELDPIDRQLVELRVKMGNKRSREDESE